MIMLAESDTETLDRSPLHIRQTEGEIRALTSLRGVAAMAVVMQHFSTTVQSHTAVPIPSLVPHGYVAVDLFFVLSGFIISFTYFDDFFHRSFRATPKFILKRLGRLFPLNLFAVAGVVLVAGILTRFGAPDPLQFSKNRVFDIICNVLMLQGIGIGMNLNAPSWSISDELVAYLAFPFLFRGIFRRGWTWAALLLLPGLCGLGVIAATHPVLGLATYSIEGGLVRCFAEFIMGMAAFRLFCHPAGRTIRRNPRVATALVGLSLVIALVRLDLLLVLTFPGLICALASRNTVFSRALAVRPFHWLGEISFSIYLLHEAFRWIYLFVLQRLHPAPLTASQGIVAAFAGSLLILPIAYLAYRFVEKPGRLYFHRLC
jgi:peptidoglycan/LPS O-acetylase OafA/YrhL